MQRPEEPLDLRTSDGVSPLLGLHVDLVETEAVLADDAVYAPVPALPQPIGSIITTAAIPDGLEHIEHEALEEAGILIADAVQQLGDQSSA